MEILQPNNGEVRPDGQPASIVWDGERFRLRLSKADKGHLCQVVFCRCSKRKERESRKRSYVRSICNRCRSLLYRWNHEEEVAYNRLRFHAKARGIAFGFTREQFHCLCLLSGYLSKRGRHRDEYHIDRKDPREGYHMWNCQVILSSINSGKDNSFYHGGEEDPF